MSRQPIPENPVLDEQPVLSLADDHEKRSIDKRSSVEANVVPARKSKGHTFISSISKDEPLVTRKELWSYYRVYASHLSTI